MPLEDILRECRETGQALREEIAAVHETMNVLARSLALAFEEGVKKDDMARLEEKLAVLIALVEKFIR